MISILSRCNSQDETICKREYLGSSFALFQHLQATAVSNQKQLMKSLFLSTTFCLLFSASTIFAQQTSKLTHDGLEREYFVHLPSNYEAGVSMPLVINMHGYGSSWIEQMIYSNFNNVANANDFIVVYPQGLNDLTGTPHFNAYFSPSAIDDVGFISQLIDQLYTDYNIDLSRVYSTGMSNGGFMSYRLACELPERIAAIASVTGGMLQIQANNCNPGRPIPTMQIHGTDDETVPFVYEPNPAAIGDGIDDVVGYWVTNNGCEAVPDTTAIEDIVMTDATTASLLTWDECETGADVHFYIIDGGGHTWPGAFPIPSFGNTNGDFSASQVVWEFFSRFQHPDPADGTILSSTTFNAAQDISISPNPFQDFIEIKGQVEAIELYNQIGQLVKAEDFQRSDARLETANLTAGVYLLAVTTKEGKRVYKIVK